MTTKISGNLIAHGAVIWLTICSPLHAGSLIGGGLLRVSVDRTGQAPLSHSILVSSSPIDTSHLVNYWSNSSSSTYSGAWADDNMDFHVASSHHLEVGSNFAQELNTWDVMPSVDSILTVHGEYDYSHPSDALGSAAISSSVRLYGTSTIIGGDGDSGGTTGGGPMSGVLIIDYSLTLLANTKYHLSNGMTSEGNTSPTSIPYNGNGFMDFSIRPVPEPAALFPLALLATFCRSRRP